MPECQNMSKEHAENIPLKKMSPDELKYAIRKVIKVWSNNSYLEVSKDSFNQREGCKLENNVRLLRSSFQSSRSQTNKYDLKDLSTPVFLPGGPRDGGAWLAAIYGVAQSRTQLKWLGSKGSLAEGLFYSVHSFDFFTLYFTFLLVNSKKNHEFSCSK